MGNFTHVIQTRELVKLRANEAMLINNFFVKNKNSLKIRDSDSKRKILTEISEKAVICIMTHNIKLFGSV